MTTVKSLDAKKCLVFAAFAVAMSSYAATWYVDAENGNDAWNGAVPAADAVPGSGVGPKQTLAVFTNLLAKGDTIYVAPGSYTNGVANSNFRFYSDAGKISLIATGDASNTFIVGEADKTVAQTTSPFGCGPNAVVPIKMLGGENVVKGFTITGGRQTSWTKNENYYGGGAAFSSSSKDRMVDCVVSDCVAYCGGGVTRLNNALRCRFTGNYAAENGAHAIWLEKAVNCIFENAEDFAVYTGNTGGTFVNCLCRGNKTGNFRSGRDAISVYNSVFLLGGGLNNARNKNCSFDNCFFDYDPMSTSIAAAERASATNGECRVFSTGSLRFNADGSPMNGNPVVDAGVQSYYDDNFFATTLFDSSEKNFDFAKNARVFGDAMDIGAVERNAAVLDDDTWFVDAVNGDDSNSGKTAAQAFKTLARASTNSLMVAGSTVHVAEGVYNSGVVSASFHGVDATDCRMMVSNGVHFIATGRREETIVEGASDSTTSGIGPNAVRCCLMHSGSIRGFTLRNGNVNANADLANGDQGGGIKCGAANTYDSTFAAYAYDCEIHHCNAVRGGGAQGVTLLRCYLHDNTINVSGIDGRNAAANGAYFCSGYNTVVDGEVNRGSLWLNCTLLGGCWGQNLTFANCYIGEDRSTSAGIASTFTNCVCAGAYKQYSTHDGCIANTPCTFDENWRSRKHKSTLVNIGDGTLYMARFPEALSAYRDMDYAGGERILEDQIDIGAGEFIWKPTGMVLSFR